MTYSPSFAPPKKITILATDAFSAEDRAGIAALLPSLKTPTIAHQLAVPKGYQMEWVDHRNRMAVLKLRGVEVMLYFRRMTIPLDLGPSEVTSAVHISDDQAWLSVNLLENSSHVYVTALLDKIREMEAMIQHQAGLIASSGILIDQQEETLVQHTIRTSKKQSVAWSQANPKIPDKGPQETATIRMFLSRIRPYAVQQYVREVFLWNQGVDPVTLRRGSVPHPSRPANKKWGRKIELVIKRLNVFEKELRVKGMAIPYEVPPPKVRKSKPKPVKKVVKKKGKKKP